VEGNMNTKLYNLYGFVCIFPLWILRSNLDLSDIILSFVLFGFLPVLINFCIIKYNSKKFNIFFILWLSCISFYGVDQNIGLWPIKSHFFLNNLTSPYFIGLFNSFLLIIFFFIIIKFMRVNGVKILFSFLLILFIFNIFDKNKYYSNFPRKVLLESKPSFDKKNPKKIIIIFDEMSGFESVDNKVKNGQKINQDIIDFFINKNFNIYTSAYSLFRDTDKSLGSILNLIENKNDYFEFDKKKAIHFIEKSNNFFVSNDLISNKFFDLNENQNIVVTQSMYINYCKHPKVIICNQFDPYNKKIQFLDGFKNTKMTRYFSFYRNNGAITSYLVWRILLEFRAIDTILDPVGEKAAINYIFDNLLENIKTKKNTTLFFSHILAPHIPYTYDEECNFDGSRSINFNRISISEKRLQHNIEKKCLIKFLDIFLQKLEKINKFDDFEILIFSDHDSRIVNAEEIFNNVIFVHKKKNSSSSKIIKKQISINKIFKNLYN
jgi:hypothetical protein